MKNKIYYFGIICSLAISIGCIFKIMHLAGAGIILSIGFMLFTLVYIPMALVKSYQSENNKSVKWLYIAAFISILIATASALFKIRGWSGAGLLMIVGIPIPFLVFLPTYLIFFSKSKDMNYNNLLLVLFFFAYFASITALLSVNVSKEVVNESILGAYQQEKKFEITNDQAKSLLVLYPQNIINGNKAMQMHEINQRSDDIYRAINAIEQRALLIVDPRNESCILNDGKINFWNIKGKDSNIKGFGKLFYDDLTNLEKIIIVYSQFVKPMIKSDAQCAVYVNKSLKANELLWNYSNYWSGSRLIFFIQMLEQLKTKIAIVTYESLSYISEI